MQTIHFFVVSLIWQCIHLFKYYFFIYKICPYKLMFCCCVTLMRKHTYTTHTCFLCLPSCAHNPRCSLMTKRDRKRIVSCVQRFCTLQLLLVLTLLTSIVFCVFFCGSVFVNCNSSVCNSSVMFCTRFPLQ